MYSKSSTFLALASILSILAVLSITISDLKEVPTRKLFGGDGENSSSTNKKIPLANGWDSFIDQYKSADNSKNVDNLSKDDLVIEDILKMTEEDKKYFQENIKNLDTSSVKLNFEDSSVVKKDIPNDTAKPVGNLNNVIAASPATQTNSQQVSSTDLLVRKINDETLRKAGFSEFVIKPRPFDGVLFGVFDIKMLGSLEIIEKNVVENRNGNEVNVLTAYEFQLGTRETTQEIYDYLKAKIKNELGITINESNQFGMSSFYINFGVASESVFLVVKTRDNVYALSYPKAKYGNKDYFVLTSALFKELI